MSSKIFGATIVGLVVLATTARGSQSRESVVLFSTQDDKGVVTEYRVSADKLAAVKHWSPESEPPPLSIAAAVATAKKSLKPKRPADLEVVGIEMTPVNSGKARRWFYRVSCYDTTQAYGAEPPAILVAVMLMDGSLVEPAKGRHH